MRGDAAGRARLGYLERWIVRLAVASPVSLAITSPRALR